MSLNHDLQATHEVIRFLEEAKSQSELVLDSLPGFFLIIDSSGMIFRGNRRLSHFLNTDLENLIGRRFDQILGSKWPEFLEKISESKKNPELGIDFEMDIPVSNAASPASFLWNIRPMFIRGRQDLDPEISVVTGRDITEVKQVTEKMTRMQSELLTAKTVQDTLFPEGDCLDQHASIAGYYEPASECGGDWWYYNFIGKKLFLWIGDVSGHGVGAALVTSAARAAVSVIETMADVGPAQALAILDRAVFAASRGQKFMSFFVASIDLETSQCIYASAAHEPPIFITKSLEDKSKHSLKFLSSPASYLLGQQSGSEFVENTILLERGDRIFLYTDGVTELENEAQEQWGIRRVRKAIQKCSEDAGDVSSLVANFTTRLQKYRNGTELKDDTTFFAFELRKN